MWTHVITRFGTPGNRHWQRTPIHQPWLHRLLQGLGHKAYLFHTKTSSIQRASGIHQQNSGEHDQVTSGGCSWKMGKRATRGTMGLRNHPQNSHAGNSFLTSLRHRSHRAHGSARNDDRIRTYLSGRKQRVNGPEPRSARWKKRAPLRNWSYQQDIAKSYNRKVRTTTFQEGDSVLQRVFDNTKEKSARKLTPGWKGPY